VQDRGSAVLSGIALLGLVAHGAGAQTAEEINQANNPLTPKVTLNLQDQWAPRLYDASDDYTNSVLLRGVVPHALGGHPQIFRFTQPITTVKLDGDGHTGSGDLNLFNLWLTKAGAFEVGIGPQLTMPTASRDETGTGKWQAGLLPPCWSRRRNGALPGRCSHGSTHSWAIQTARRRSTASRSRC